MNGDPRTVRELFFFCKEKFENIEDKFGNIEKNIIEIKNNPDNMGKWTVRILIGINSIAAVVFILYKIYKGV